MRPLYERPKYVPKQQPRQGVPKRGLYSIDTLKHLSGLSVDEMQVIGIDPGMIDLIHCVDPDRILETQPIGEPPASLVYTAARRKHETCSVLYRKRMEEDKKQTSDVLTIEKEMGKYSRHSTDGVVLLSYFDARRSGSISLEAFYEDLTYRIRRWRSFQKEQRSMQKLIDRMEGMRTKETMGLAYGSAVAAISKLRPKGTKTFQINVGLRLLLSKHFFFVCRRHTGTLHLTDVLRLPLSVWSVYGTGRATTQRIEVEKRARNGRMHLPIRRKTLRAQALSRDQRASPLPKRRMWSHLAP